MLSDNEPALPWASSPSLIIVHLLSQFLRNSRHVGTLGGLGPEIGGSILHLNRIPARPLVPRPLSRGLWRLLQDSWRLTGLVRIAHTSHMHTKRIIRSPLLGNQFGKGRVPFFLPLGSLIPQGPYHSKFLERQCTPLSTRLTEIYLTETAFFFCLKTLSQSFFAQKKIS